MPTAYPIFQRLVETEFNEESFNSFEYCIYKFDIGLFCLDSNPDTTLCIYQLVIAVVFASNISHDFDCDIRFTLSKKGHLAVKILYLNRQDLNPEPVYLLTSEQLANLVELNCITCDYLQHL
jgi:hypothetical protein